MAKPFYDLSDTNLLVWSNSFTGHILPDFAAYHITEDMAEAYQARNTEFSTALAAWWDNSTKTPIASQNKKDARTALLAMAKYLVATINSNPAITDAQRDELGIKARKKPSPQPAPTTSPIVEVLSVSGRTVTIGLHPTESGKRGKPKYVKGANVFTFVGAVAPTDAAAWKFEGLITKTKFDLSFDGSTTANTVWVTAKWFNERGETGAACAPVSINLPAAIVLPQANGMKIAA